MNRKTHYFLQDLDNDDIVYDGYNLYECRHAFLDYEEECDGEWMPYLEVNGKPANWRNFI